MKLEKLTSMAGRFASVHFPELQDKVTLLFAVVRGH